MWAQVAVWGGGYTRANGPPTWPGRGGALLLERGTLHLAEDAWDWGLSLGRAVG